MVGASTCYATHVGRYFLRIKLLLQAQSFHCWESKVAFQVRFDCLRFWRERSGWTSFWIQLNSAVGLSVGTVLECQQAAASYQTPTLPKSSLLTRRICRWNRKCAKWLVSSWSRPCCIDLFRKVGVSTRQNPPKFLASPFRTSLKSSPFRQWISLCSELVLTRLHTYLSILEPGI